MLPPLALAPEAGQTVLDMCSSPGSKTGFLAQLVGPAGFVLANEVSHARLFTLRTNLRVCNFLQVATCSYEGQHLPLKPGSFECIQLDPPCSGWGTVEKNPGVLKLWHDDKIKPLIGLQRLLLQKAAELLRPGGRVVYSTCTTNSEENERQVLFAEQQLGLKRDFLDPFPGFYWDEREGSEGTLRVDGDRSKAQGFFVARMHKPAESVIDLSSSLASSFPRSDRKESRPFCRPGMGHQGRARSARSSAGQSVPSELLACETVDPARIPPGNLAVFAETLRFLPLAAETLLPEGFVWQGAALGKFGRGGFQPDCRLRVLVPEEGPRLVLDTVQELRDLLCGKTMAVQLPGPSASLWWRDLPLGRVGIRNGRVIAAFQR